jgi:hypothetical protein
VKEIDLEPRAFSFDGPEVTLYVSEEGARYIAEVMQEEYLRTHDSGALGIAERLEEGL